MSSEPRIITALQDSSDWEDTLELPEPERLLGPPLELVLMAHHGSARLIDVVERTVTVATEDDVGHLFFPGAPAGIVALGSDGPQDTLLEGVVVMVSRVADDVHLQLYLHSTPPDGLLQAPTPSPAERRRSHRLNWASSKQRAGVVLHRAPPERPGWGELVDISQTGLCVQAMSGPWPEGESVELAVRLRPGGPAHKRAAHVVRAHNLENDE